MVETWTQALPLLIWVVCSSVRPEKISEMKSSWSVGVPGYRVRCQTPPDGWYMGILKSGINSWKIFKTIQQDWWTHSLVDVCHEIIMCDRVILKGYGELLIGLECVHQSCWIVLKIFKIVKSTFWYAHISAVRRSLTTNRVSRNPYGSWTFHFRYF